MPIIQQKTHSAANYQMLTVKQPAFGGLNIEDLEYTLPLNQSPSMLNMMYKNGVLGKRYGQTSLGSPRSVVLAMHVFDDSVFMQTTSGHIYKYKDGSFTLVSDASGGKLTKKGFFFTFAKELYFLNIEYYMKYNDSGFEEIFEEITPTVPDIMINMKPDGTGGTTIDPYNLYGGWFANTFHGDGTSKTYHLTDKNLGNGKVKVQYTDSAGGVRDYTEGDGNFTVDRTNGTVTFSTAPVKGNLNVKITAQLGQSDTKTQTAAIAGCTMAIAYGGANNSHLFLAGNGTSNYYYSYTADPTYFPETYYAMVGNSESDITGFGIQYNVLIVFKPTEIYQISYSYEMNSVTNRYEVTFSSKPVNVQVGCDMPNTIQYIDNRLTWGNTLFGICTLCSTVIQDERNVRSISRNINGGERQYGLLAEDGLKDAIAVDYDGKYILYVNHHMWMWDYTNAPYSDSTRYTSDELAKATAWFYWDSIGYRASPVTAMLVANNILYYASGNVLCRMDNSLTDFNDGINAYYQTPMFDFQAFESLKTIKKAFFEVRGDTPSNTKILYITDEDSNGEEDPEPLLVGANMWEHFSWDAFAWAISRFARTFARKCSIKKVELFGCKLSNDEPNRDLNITSMKFEYTIVKEIK